MVEPIKDSILNDIKKLLGFEPDYQAFDTDIQLFINSAFSVLHQIGASRPSGFRITGPEETWTDFLEERENVDSVKEYIYLSVRLIFDPPATSFAQDAFKAKQKELEWRLNALELVFNPNAYVGLVEAAQPFWWILETDGHFPPEAKDGDVGWNPETKKVWRKVDGS